MDNYKTPHTVTLLSHYETHPLRYILVCIKIQLVD
jgi:hypothetical protein